jgi:hypothetical protein
VTENELEALVSDITYKPGYTLVRDGMTLRWEIDAPDAYHRFDAVKVVNQWFTIHSDDSKAAALRMIFAFLAYHEDHEMREFFKYRGKSPYNPHRKGAQVTIDHHIDVQNGRVNFVYNGDHLR